MKKYIIAITLMLSLSISAIAASKPDYITRNADGSVKTRGVYQVDESGRVLKFTVYDGAGTHLYTESPYYSPDGHLIRADTHDASGKLKSVGVFFDTFVKVLDADGNVVDTQSLGNEKDGA